MDEELSNLNEEEQLKAENDFLKMKLMLEHGGYFSRNEESEMTLPPEIENQFLNNILEFEKQYEQRKSIKIFDKIGRPGQFRPVQEIVQSDICDAWNELDTCLRDHGVVLEACSPNVTPRDLYRFATEELFDLQTDDIRLPGWSTNFIYDEFYPDPVYDNSQLVREEFTALFGKDELFAEMHYSTDGFVFNGKAYASFKAFSARIHEFQSLFDEIDLVSFAITSCEVGKTDCIVQGNYTAVAWANVQEVNFSGNYSVRLMPGTMGYWYMKEIQIEGLNL